LKLKPSDVLYVANKIANRTSSWRDPELDGVVDTSMLDTIFDAETLEEIIEESEEEVQSLKSRWAAKALPSPAAAGGLSPDVMRAAQAANDDRGMNSSQNQAGKSPANVWPYWRWRRSASSMATSAPARCMR
jgi:hypothetical protein